jgi:nucleotide-binding universal stress UspA family protein
MKILIGYDGSLCADAALDDLARAGLPEVAEVQILSVAEVWLPPPPPSIYEIVEQAREVKVPSDLRHVYTKGCEAATAALTSAQRASDRVKAIFPRWDVSADSACGSPAWELVFKADNWRPDLVVVGSHGRTALGRFVLGSVSQRVLNEARCSVRIARGRVDEPDTPVRIVIGLDGSPGSEAAVKAVAARKWPENTEVMLLAIDDPLASGVIGKIPPIAHMIEETNEEDRLWSEEMLSDAAGMLQASDVKIIQRIKHGDPRKDLPRIAEEWGADCIFVGSTGFSNRFERFILGSVSASVAARSHCSVEVVRSTERAR